MLANCRYSLLMFIFFFSLLVPASFAKTSFDRGREIGKYVGLVVSAKYSVERIVDYCALQFPDMSDSAKKAKLKWEERNLPVVNSWKRVVQNWLAKEAPSADNAEIIKSVEVGVEQQMELIRSMDPIVNTLQSQSAEERKKSCNSLVVAIDSGGRDIKTMSPEAYKIFEKYSAQKSDSPTE